MIYPTQEMFVDFDKDNKLMALSKGTVSIFRLNAFHVASLSDENTQDEQTKGQ